MQKSNVKYTPEAEKRLERAKGEFVEQIEAAVKSRKYYPGDEVLEITASDIENATRYLVFRRPNKTMTKLIMLIMYMLFGIVMALIGLFYDSLIILIRDNPIRLMFIFTGLMVSLISLFMYIKIKGDVEAEAAKEDYIKKKELENRYS